MRITNPTILRGYNRDLNRLLDLKNQSERKITSGRSFSRASDAPLSAAKALNVRKSMYDSTQYSENLKVASKFYTEAETTLLQVSEKMASVRETLIAACNTYKDQQDFSIYAQQLETTAQELCAMFNTDSAERSIFGGESNVGQPFTIINDANGNPSTVLYHGVPLSAMNDCNAYPYSNGVYIDIGIGMETDQKTHESNPQSMLCISFNGAEVTGCGAEYGTADIDLSSIKAGKEYCFDIYAGGVKRTISFTGTGDKAADVAAINDQITKEVYKKDIAYGRNYPYMDENGVITLRKNEGAGSPIPGDPIPNEIVCAMNNEVKNPHAAKLTIDNDTGYTDKFKMNLDAMEDGKSYSCEITVGEDTKTVTFTAGATAEDTIAAMQTALDDAFGEGIVNVGTYEPRLGMLTSEGNKVKIKGAAVEGSEEMPFKREAIYSNNYIQLTLDAARALKNGDLEYANGCIDRIVSANENLLVEIADLGCNEQFIDFNQERITTRLENLTERYTDLEVVDDKKEISLWKTYEALYNACLQMSSSVVPNSIFNYMK